MKFERQRQELIAAQALEWFVAHRANELPETQREAFIDWLSASPEHAREYLTLGGLSEDLGQLAKRFATPTETLIQRARAEHEQETVQSLFPGTTALPRANPGACVQSDAASASTTGRRRAFLLRARAIAAVVALVALGIGIFSAWQQFENRGTYSTAHAEQRSWRMPDGSTVHLNSGSQIKVRFDEQRRDVDLIRGQALFQVAKDAHRPFWVHAGDAVVKAVGTEFDVYRSPQRTLVSVVEGRVAVWQSAGYASSEPPANEPVAQLDAGQQARISRASAVVSKKAGDVRKTVAWLQRQVVFDHDALGSAVEEFNRYSDLRIRIEDASLLPTEVSGIFSAYDAEAFIRFLEHQPDMVVKRSGAEVIVTAIH